MNSSESLRNEILDTIEHYYQMRFSSIHAMDTIINAIEKRIDELYPENPIDTQYKTGYYNAICIVKEMLKK